MGLRYVLLRKMCLKSALLLGLVLFCQVVAKPIESSTESSPSNDILDEVTSAALEIQSSTTSTENALSNEVLPTEALVSATLRVPKHPPGTTTTTTEGIPILNRNQVSLALPDDLFSSTANLTLTLRNFIGDFITRTSVRIAQVVRFFQPLFGYHLMIDIPKELDV
ncbi:AGAP000696-PB-like protein [Anopheles sinensis]|uniref:AGAP000696-PB-like protein n=1 Tax=Anopheles sinensis TaxID=74873 RepID=A0A084VVE9_ANOSI|nr:AGAP000696-PB-like protein [Anopheles sinensis]